MYYLTMTLCSLLAKLKTCMKVINMCTLFISEHKWKYKPQAFND